MQDKNEAFIKELVDGHKDRKKLRHTDEFKEVSQCFDEKGVYTEEIPNPHPNSSYMKFWKREMNRCIYGLDLGWDFIPGYYYFYLNYSRIQKVIEYQGDDQRSSSVRAERDSGFPNVWDSDYDFFHYIEEAEKAGQHANVLKTRGRGYSYKGGSMLCRNYFLIPGSRSYALASEKVYLTESDGILSKAWEIMNFVDSHTPWAKKRHYKDKDMHKRASYEAQVKGNRIEKGYKSEIIGISLKDDPDKARGNRGKLILFEESGKFPGLLHAWQVARPSVEQGKRVFGTLLAFGTGGTKGSNFEGAEEIFYNPEAYNVRPLYNRWDVGSLRGKTCSLFIPEYFNREGEGLMDKDGNSKIEEAIRDTMDQREREEKGNIDPATISQKRAEQPFTPQEAMMTQAGGFFPVEDLRQRLADLESSPKERDASHVGYFTLDKGEPVWHPSEKYQPIREFPKNDDGTKEGAIEIFEHPSTNSQGEIPSGLYIAGMDTADDDDVEQSSSLLSTFVMNALTRRIVAEYTGRPVLVKQYYENMRRLLLYYNATCNYENNKKGVFTYFENKACTHLLCETPQMLKDKDIVSKARSGNAAYGTPANAKINSFARKLIREWLLEEAYNSEGQFRNLDTIRSVALLKELYKWNPEGNFDRVSAMGMLMIYEESERRFLMDEEELESNKARGSPEIEDPFFQKIKDPRKQDERLIG